MHVKHYGIFLAYPPTADLRGEGLGRHLAAFLDAASKRENVRFVVLCPHWTKEGLLQLCRSEGVDETGFDLVTTERVPFILKMFQAYQRWTGRKRQLNIARRIFDSGTRVLRNHRRWLEQMVVSSKRGWRLPFIGVYLLIVGLLFSPFIFIYVLYSIGRIALRETKPRLPRFALLAAVHAKLHGALHAPQDDAMVFGLYKQMAQNESQNLVKIANKLSHVAAWYCPAAFWPAFNEIAAPRIMCVPDVVFADFPVGFAGIGGNRFLESFNDVEAAIKGATHCVTYSEHVKWSTLVDRYGLDARMVHVIPHAANKLNGWVEVSGFPDNETTARNYCRQLVHQSLLKSTNLGYTSYFKSVDFPFIFYASQIRPNKNVMALLRAYNYLLKERFISQKLLMTGDPANLADVGAYIKEHDLHNDVLFLRGLSISELSACYRLADLAVNPSLSEGGCPFTFTEALSVGTPVVMARIPVTLEVLNVPELTEATFFDPFDWRDMANQIEWALHHRQKLLDMQLPVYRRLANRTWSHVVDEYVGVLDKISQPAGSDD